MTNAELIRYLTEHPDADAYETMVSLRPPHEQTLTQDDLALLTRMEACCDGFPVTLAKVLRPGEQPRKVGYALRVLAAKNLSGWKVRAVSRSSKGVRWFVARTSQEVK